jgi:hypothetical protein
LGKNWEKWAKWTTFENSFHAFSFSVSRTTTYSHSAVGAVPCSTTTSHHAIGKASKSMKILEFF